MDFDFRHRREPLRASAVSFTFATVLLAIGSAAYTPQSGTLVLNIGTPPPSGVDFNFVDVETPPAASAVDFTFAYSFDPVAAPAFLARPGLRWSASDPFRVPRGFAATAPTSVDTYRSVLWGDGQWLGLSLALVGESAQALDLDPRLPWSDAGIHHGVPFALAWDGLPPAINEGLLIRDDGPAETLERAWRFSWSEGSRLERTVEIPWDSISPYAESEFEFWGGYAPGPASQVDFAFGTAPRRLRLEGSGAPYLPPHLSVPLALNAPPPLSSPIDFDWEGQVRRTVGVSLNLSMLAPWGTGRALNQLKRLPWGAGEPLNHDVGQGWSTPPNDPDPNVPTFPLLGVYTVNNSVAVVRLPERTPIAVLGLQASAQIDSTAWSVSLTLATQQALDLLNPASAGPREVEITINDFIITAMIEEYSLSQQFGRRAWSVSGRSRSAELAPPYADARSYRNSSLSSAQQLALDELEFTGWTLDWQTVDWVVDVGQFSYDNLTPLEAVGRIAAAVGAVVQCDPEDRVLHVLSRYPDSPWDWLTATPAAAIPDDVLLTLAARWKPANAYNAIYVSGGNQGVNVNASRTGTPGDYPLPTLVDPLIVDVDAGTERARVEISKTGNRIEQSVVLPVMAPVGVRLPGELVEVAEASTWRGLVTQLALTAQVGDSVEVQQQLTLERYVA